MENGAGDNEQLSLEIFQQELKIAEVNKRLNLHYAINELIIYNPSKIFSMYFEKEKDFSDLDRRLILKESFF